MAGVRDKTILLVIAAVWLAAAQAFSLAHAAAEGDAPHKHGGVPCALASLSQQDEDDAVPPVPAALRMPIAAPAPTAPLAATDEAPKPVPLSLFAPPTGPPADHD